MGAVSVIVIRCLAFVDGIVKCGDPGAEVFVQKTAGVKNRHPDAMSGESRRIHGVQSDFYMIHNNTFTFRLFDNRIFKLKNGFSEIKNFFIIYSNIIKSFSGMICYTLVIAKSRD